MRVLIAPDKFKGTLTAQQAAQAMARGWSRSRPQDELVLLPICDGGDGFGAAMGLLLGAKLQKCKTVNAAHEQVSASWWWQAQSRIAIIESANIIGLAMLPSGKLHPFDLDTEGLGRVILAARRKGARKILLGIGGSATNDGGFGMAQALGWKFLDRNQNQIKRWTDLRNLASIEPGNRFKRGEIVIAVDVQNPLLGSRGASRIYGPQKGLRPKDFPAAEQALRQLANVARDYFGNDFAKVPGAGAAGGLGFGLQAFAGAKLEPGFALFAEHAKLNRVLRGVDVVVTGEGAIDRSTAHGKGVGEVARWSDNVNVPCVAIGGAVRMTAAVKKLFTQTIALTDLTPGKQAQTRATWWLAQATEKLAANLVCKRGSPG